MLPFRTIGGTDDDVYFGDGITDEIITGLSRSHSFYVIARNSTLRYRDRAKDLRQIASELDVRYLLDGSVQRHGDAPADQYGVDGCGSQPADLGERFEGSTDNLFEFQDRIAASILGSIEPRYARSRWHASATVRRRAWTPITAC